MPLVPAHSDLRTPFAASAVSGHFDTRTAATELADSLFDELGSAPSDAGCDLLMLFGSYHHRSALDDASHILRKAVAPRCLLGVTAESVLGADRELEGVAGMSAIALRLPGVNIHPWHATPDDPMPLEDAEQLRQRIGYGPDFRAAIMLGEPFTTPVTQMLPALVGATPEKSSPIVVVGGMASGASQPGLNVLILNDRVVSGGAIGVSLAGDLEIDFVVSQGCRPIGKPLVVTKCKGNVILELGGRKAIEVVQETAHALPDADKRLLSNGLLLGIVVNEYKDHFGRGDFLIRNVMGVDQKAGALAVGEKCRVGQTVQFHVRDAETATQDLQLLLDAQVIQPTRPFGALLFSCNGRGERLFHQPNHDLNIIRERLGEVPIAGFFAAGEFGPIGQGSYLHGHTASLALLRGRTNPA